MSKQFVKYEIRTTLSISNFKEYFENNKLGHLYTPNGYHDPECAYERESPGLYSSLSNIYQACTGYQINTQSIPIEEIHSIIVFGSSVRQPNYEIGGRNWWNKIRKRYYKPHDLDILVVTKHPTQRDEVNIPKLQWWDGGYSVWFGLRAPGLHIIFSGVNESVSGDNIYQTAINEGVLLFGSLKFNDRLYWTLDSDGILNGYIE